MVTNIWTTAWLHTSGAKLQLSDGAYLHCKANVFHFFCTVHPLFLSFICTMEDETCRNVGRWGGGWVGVKPDLRCSPWEGLWTDAELGGKEVGVKFYTALWLPVFLSPSNLLCLTLLLSERFILDPGFVCLLTERKCKVVCAETLGNATGRPWGGKIKYSH